MKKEKIMPNIPDDIPMMFRAQFKDDNNPEYGCKLEKVDNKEDRDKWLKEWVDPQIVDYYHP